MKNFTLFKKLIFVFFSLARQLGKLFLQIQTLILICCLKTDPSYGLYSQLDLSGIYITPNYYNHASVF